MNVVDLDGVAHADRSLEQQDKARHEVVDDVLQAEADADAQRAAEHRDPIEIHAQGQQGQDEPDRDDRVLGEIRKRVGQAGSEVHAREHILREHELDQRRHDRREVHRQHECQDVPERKTERADREIDGRHERPEVVERPDDPHDHADRVQQPLSASLEPGAVMLDHAEPSQRPDPERERDEPFCQSASGDEHHCEIAARQDARSDQPGQAHVADDVGRQRDEDSRQRQLEQILAYAGRRPATGGDQVVQASRPGEPAQQRGGRQHLQHEKPALEQRPRAQEIAMTSTGKNAAIT